MKARLEELHNIAQACATDGAIRVMDLQATESLLVGIDPSAAERWAIDYGFSSYAVDLVTCACTSANNARLELPHDIIMRAYLAATIWVLVVRRKCYNYGQLAELAAAIMLGIFPAYGKANNRAAATDEPDLVLGRWGMSCKNILKRCTYAKDDKGDRLFAMLGNTGIIYILTPTTWAELEANYSETDSSRGSKRSPRSKKNITKMVQWLDGQVA